MKKILFILFVVLTLLWSCSTVLAKGGGRQRTTQGKPKHAKTVHKETGRQQADANKPPAQSKGKQTRQQKRQQTQTRQQQKSREITRKGKAKPEAAQDVNKPSGKFIKGKAERKVKAQSVEKQIGKEHQQQLKAIQRQMAHEQAKHRRRLARLNRIRELAAKEGLTETVERVDKLLEKEQQRYDRKHQRIQQRRQKVLQLAEKSSGQDTQKTIKKDTEEIKAPEKEQNKGRGKGKRKNADKTTGK